MVRSIKTCILFFIIPLNLYSQYQNIKFEHISVEQGLSYEKVYSILQDSQGFMWFATDDGLNKYDGYKFTIYRHDPGDSLSLSSNWITSLYEDRSGLLWIGTKGGGLNQFNREKEQFIHYQHDHHNSLDITPTSIERISLFQYEGEEVLWMGTYNGLYKMDVTTKKITHYPNTDKGYPYTNVESLAVDSIGTVWFGTTEGGLHKFNPENEQYTHYCYDPNNPNSLSNNRVMVLCIDRSGILWIGTAEGGLNKFDIENNKFKRFQHDPNNSSSLSSNYVLSIYEDRDGDLWVGTADGGLNLYDQETEQFTHYKNDPGDPTSLSDNTVLSIFEDRSGVLWIGTWGSLNINIPRKTQFFEYKNIC